RTSSRLRAWSRKRRAWITSTPSSVSRRSCRANTRARTASGNDGECATSKRNSTALSVRLTCCPPGPSARKKRSVNSDSGMSMEDEMRMRQRLRERRARVASGPGPAHLQVRVVELRIIQRTAARDRQAIGQPLDVHARTFTEAHAARLQIDQPRGDRARTLRFGLRHATNADVGTRELAHAAGLDPRAARRVVLAQHQHVVARGRCFLAGVTCTPRVRAEHLQYLRI